MNTINWHFCLDQVYSFDPDNGRLTEVASAMYELTGADPDQVLHF